MDTIGDMAHGNFGLKPAREQRRKDTSAHYAMQAADAILSPDGYNRQLPGVVIRKKLHLSPLGTQCLPEIALLVEDLSAII